MTIRPMYAIIVALFVALFYVAGHMPKQVPANTLRDRVKAICEFPADDIELEACSQLRAR